MVPDIKNSIVTRLITRFFLNIFRKLTWRQPINSPGMIVIGGSLKIYIITLIYTIIHLLFLFFIYSLDLDPDWHSYEAIYNEKGAYLSDQGRDWIFLWVQESFRVLGVDYHQFRIVLNSFFLFFCAYTCHRGARLIAHGLLGASIFLMSICLLFVPRVFFEIREALAMCFLVLFTLKMALKSQYNSSPKGLNFRIAGGLYHLIAMGLHFGYVAYTLNLTLCGFLKYFNWLIRREWIALTASALFTVFLTYEINEILESNLLFLYQGALDGEYDYTHLKFLYWMANLVTSLYLFKICTGAHYFGDSPVDRYFILLSIFVVNLVVVIIVLMILQASTSTMVLFVRLFNSLISILIFYLVLRGQRSVGIFFAIAFLWLQKLRYVG